MTCGTLVLIGEGGCWFCREIDIGLVQQNELARGHGIDQRLDVAGAVPGSFGVVGNGKIHQRRVVRDRCGQVRIRVLVIVAIRDGFELSVISRNMIITDRVGAE